MQSIQHFDFIVAGAGTFGLSTCFFLSQNCNLKIALVEKYQIGHDNGSSHSQSRIIRSIYKKQLYRDLCVLGINQMWNEVQEVMGQKFIVSNPSIFLPMNKEGFEEFKKVAETSNGQLQMISVEQTKKKFPALLPKISHQNMNFMDSKSGVIYAQRYIKALEKYLKNKSNVKVFQNTQLKQIINEKSQVTIKVNQKEQVKQLKAKKIILSCGRWIGQLIPQMQKIIKVNRQTIGYWEMKNMQNYQIGKFPCWVMERQDGIEYYGLPDVTGVGIKMGMHVVNDKTDLKFSTEEDLVRKSQIDLDEKVKIFFGEENMVKRTKIQKCYYTSTKTEDFLLDWSDEKENILICSTCSGHGFKFSPVIGKIASDLLQTDKSVKLFEDNRHVFKIPYHLGVELRYN